ncbi:DNA double-strand break repair nuclease NurA [Peptoniphilus sp. HCN-40583]|uniref:DNA double-strand break repair nuclease NurA n=1 Tax=Peptoniphilus sp. HCN-40583 TaxID=3134662 RepID=UPI0030BFC1E0
MNQEDLLAFRREIGALNEALKTKYDPLFQKSGQEFKKALTEDVGTVEQLMPLSEGELGAVGSVAGVDGSVIRQGGAYPHYVEFYQGLALSMEKKERRIRRIYTPLLAGDDAANAEKLHDRYLAEVELEAATALVEEEEVAVLMMDGGLLRYAINSPAKWEALRDLCLAEDTLLVGAIKDIKTRDIARRMGRGHDFYDREYLAGKLDVGELLILAEDEDEEEKGKTAAGLVGAFYRPTRHWEVVGMDVLSQQKEALNFLARLLYTLTPKNGRGVPFWIDIVDREVKVRQKEVRLILEEAMDREMMERFFVSERDRRV